MVIKGIGPKFFVNDDKQKVRQNKPGESPVKDKIEISNEARTLQNSPGVKDLSEVKKRIESKFYNSKEVIEKVAEKILKQIRE